MQTGFVDGHRVTTWYLFVLSVLGFLLIFAISETKEARASVKFCFLLGKTAAETVVILQTAYSDAAMRKTQLYEWFSRLSNGHLLLKDQLKSERRSTFQMNETITKIHELIIEERR